MRTTEIKQNYINFFFEDFNESHWKFFKKKDIKKYLSKVFPTVLQHVTDADEYSENLKERLNNDLLDIFAEELSYSVNQLSSLSEDDYSKYFDEELDLIDLIKNVTNTFVSDLPLSEIK